MELATPNYRRHALFVPNDPFYATQWHYPQINLPSAWDLSTGNNTIVAVIDTGVVFQHLFECLRSGRVFPQDEAKRSTILRAK